MFFASHGTLEHAILSDLPAMSADAADARVVPIAAAIGPLAQVSADRPASPSLRCFAALALLALELAAGQRAIPKIIGENARWHAVLTTRADRDRADAIADALPKGSLPAGMDARQVVREVLDAAIDALYRRGTWPGPGKGWTLELAEALRIGDGAFQVRDPRFRSVPEQLDAWATEAESGDLRLGLALELPTSGEKFQARFRMAADDGHAIDLESAWGSDLPLWNVLRGLARAAKLHPPLAAAIVGPRPRVLTWRPAEVWSFLHEGVPALRAAGFDVDLPEGFEPGGHSHLRTSLCVGLPPNDVSPETPCPCRWQVTLAGDVLTAADIATLRAAKHAIIEFRGQWIVLDPDDLASLPTGPEHLTLPASEALAAVFSGTWRGVHVVADEGLDALIELLKHPPALAAPPGLHAELRPYQGRGVAWLTTMGRLGLGACLADDMGLGKTIQLIAHLVHRQGRPDHRPSLVVCPTSVLGNWAREIRRFAPSLSIVRYHGLDRPVDDILGADVVLTTYGLLVRDIEMLAAAKFDVIALDEAQAIKNADSQRAVAARRLDARHRVALSGTPVENRLEELWSLMQFLVPGFLGPRARFRREVALPIERFGDAGVAQHLREMIAPFLLRRVKSDPDIAPDLPEKFEQRQFCPLTAEQARLYKDIVAEELERVSEASARDRRGRVLAMLTRLKQCCNHPAQALHEDSDTADIDGRSGKLARCIELLQNIAERGERALVFTQYREMGDLLQRAITEEFGRAVPFLHGGVPAPQRDEMVAAFQTDEGPLAPVAMLLSLRAGGTGLNLTRAQHVIHFDRWWNPAVEDQATDRAHRIGQERDVFVHKLVCQDTLEERIDALLDEKRALADQVVGSGEGFLATLDDDALRRLVQLGSDAVVE